MINTFFYLQKDKLNITKIRKLLFFAIILILQNTINSKLSRSYAYDVTCRYMGTMCNPSEPICASDDYCTHYRYAGGAGRCDNGQNRWNYWICPENCDGVLPPTCEPSGGGGGGGDLPGCPENNCWGTHCNCCVVGNTFCADNCTEIPPSIGIGTCSDGRKLCEITSCGVCNGPCTSGDDPKGAFDGASCSPTGVISGYGWTCDKDNYSTSLTANIYKGNASTENLIASVTANIPAESAVGLACGNDPNNVNHRFTFSTSPVTFSPGTYKIKAYGVNIGDGSDAELPSSRTVTCPICTPIVDGGLSDWGTCSAACEEYDTQLATCTDPAPSCGGSDCSAECTAIGGDTYIKNLGHCLKDCYGGPCCTVNPGTLSGWTQCSGGKQTRTCDGATCCPAGCTPGSPGCTCGNCGGEPLERPCLRIDGNIWSDDDRNGITISDYWKKDSNTPSNCNTVKTFSDFSMTISGETSPSNQIYDWWCHPKGYGVYFNSPGYAIEPESTKTLALTRIPDGYDPLSWKYRYLKDGVETSQTGPGGIASDLLMPPYAAWVNIHWELQQQTYNLTINVKKIKPEIIDLPDQCTDGGIYDGSLENASITVYDADDVSQVVCSGSSNSEGKLTCPIWILQGPLKIEATKTVGGAAPETYELRCPNSTVYEYDPGSVNDGDNKSVGIGLKVNYKDGWVSAIDSDIFANLLSVVVPEGPTDNSDTNQTPQGFAKTLINSSLNMEKSLGFIFSEVNDRSNPNVDTKCPSSKGFETTDHQCTNLGGFSYDLISGGEHDSKWLESFTFTPPSGATQLSGVPNSFKANTVYKITQDEYNVAELPNTYNITGGSGVSVLYIEGNLRINTTITNTTPNNGRLLVIVNGTVTISKDVGTTLTTLPANNTDFVMSRDPHIMAGIIASGNIEFQSVSGIKTKDNRDKAIMVSAPLISKDSLTFGRDLYHDNNATMPAESAKAFNKYLYFLSSLEREKSQDYLYFTGVTTFDLDWEYIY